MKEWLLILLLAQSADAATTCVGLRSGAQEINPLRPQSCSGNIAISAGVSLGQVWALRKINGLGHPTLARTLAGIQIGVSSAAAGNNLAVIVRIR